MTEYEACYVFNAVNSGDTFDTSNRSPKRRKTAKVGKPNVGDAFVPLLRGTEAEESLRSRYHVFQTLWHSKEELIDETGRIANDDTVDRIVSFVRERELRESVNIPYETTAIFDKLARPRSRLSTALITAGPNNSNSLDFRDVYDRVNSEERAVFVRLTSDLSSNLKTVLKHINQQATSQSLANGEEFDGILAKVLLTGRNIKQPLTVSKGGRQLNYDLQILCDFGRRHSIRKVIILFEDSEAFEGTLLSDVIEVLSSWNNRIPFVLLFSIATSIQLFQDKLSKETIRRLSGTEFKVERVDTEEIFRQIHDQEPSLFFGPAIGDLILKQRHDFIQSPAAFAQTLKYAYMTHFFANPLSVLLCEDPASAILQKEHYEAIRNLPSFRMYAQALIDERRYEDVRDMLDDDEALNDTVMQEIMNGRNAMQNLLSALRMLFAMQSHATSKVNVSWSELYIQAMSGSLLDGPNYNDLVSSIKKLPSDALEGFLTLSTDNIALPQAFADDLLSVNADLVKLISTLLDPSTPLRSAYDIHHSTMRTTVVAQKVSLSKNSSKLSSQDNDYTKIVDRVYDILTDYMHHTLINPQTLFLNEIWIYDLKSPHRDVFTPNPRYANERALSSPHDYLACECCSAEKGVGLEASQPATAILYQLYLESGALINTADLWEAFWTIMGSESAEDEEGEKERVLALFSRALAELKYMGMIKNSRKKADHIAKLAWPGL